MEILPTKALALRVPVGGWVGYGHTGKEGGAEGRRRCEGIWVLRWNWAGACVLFREREYKVVSFVSFSGVCAVRGSGERGD